LLVYEILILINAFPNISFDRPLDIQNADDGTNRLFVVEQRGMIHVFDNDRFVTNSSVFLDIMEGSNCHDPPSLCDMLGLIFPIVAYPRMLGAAVIGGHVYRGSMIPELIGSFIYGDFISGSVWALRFNGIDPTVNTEILRFDPFSIVSFGVDENNELLACSLDGRIYRLTREVG